jgi:hypothetical protein
VLRKIAANVAALADEFIDTLVDVLVGALFRRAVVRPRARLP